MSIFKRLVGGAAQAGAQIANKYLDDQIATQRAQMLAELQRTTAGQIREDDDAFRNDPTRVARDRDRRAADIEAEGRVRRGQKVADLTDPDLVAAESTKAERDAADARRRRVDDITATTPAEVNRAGLLAKATAKHSGAGKQTLTGRIKEIEDAIGRTLTQQEREGLVGLGKTEEGFAKFRRSLVMEAVKAGSLSPDDAEAKIKSLEQSDGISAGIAAARKDGKTAEAIEELRSRGFKPEQLSKWFTDEELKPKPAATVAPASKATGAVIDRPAGQTPIEETKTPDGRTMYRVAGSQQWYGSKSEARTAQYKQPREVVDTGGFEPGY